MQIPINILQFINSSGNWFLTTKVFIEVFRNFFTVKYYPHFFFTFSISHQSFCLLSHVGFFFKISKGFLFMLFFIFRLLLQIFFYVDPSHWWENWLLPNEFFFRQALLCFHIANGQSLQLFKSRAYDLEVFFFQKSNFLIWEPLFSYLELREWSELFTHTVILTISSSEVKTRSRTFTLLFDPLTYQVRKLSREAREVAAFCLYLAFFPSQRFSIS